MTTENDLHAKLTLQGYLDVQNKGEAGVAGITRLMMSCAVVGGLDEHGRYKVRRDYPTYDLAKRALEVWDGTGRPALPPHPAR
jgi:hypothetical protein